MIRTFKKLGCPTHGLAAYDFGSIGQAKLLDPRLRRKSAISRGECVRNLFKQDVMDHISVISCRGDDSYRY
jgi:hypothetical protein